MNADDFNNLMLKEEPLCDELKPFLQHGWMGEMIHHPLIIEMFYRPGYCALINFQYRFKKAKADKYLKEREWGSYIFLVERPYRLAALRKCRVLGLVGEDYWKMVRSVWIDTENFHQNIKVWKKIWQTKDKHKHAVMSAEEHLALSEMPGELLVWRGVQFERSKRGLSWTLDMNKAKWFARRHLPSKRIPLLVTGKVRKEDVYAYYNGRNEQEIVSNHVTITRVEELELTRKE